MAKKDIIPSGEQSDFIMYHSKDGKVNVALMTRDGNVWLNQQQIATLFATSKQNVGQYIAKILKENELGASLVVNNYFTTASDGKPYDVMYYSLLESAEMRMKERKDLTLDFWRENVNALLTFQGQKILVGNGRVSSFDMEAYVKEVYARFDSKRKVYEAELADQDDLKFLEDLEEQIKKDNKGNQ